MPEVHAKTAASQQTLDVLLAYIDGELKSKTGEMLERAERTLTSMWPDMHDAVKQAAARSAARWLKENKQAVQDSLYRRLLQSLSDPSVPKVIESENLNVMDEDTLNVIVIRAQMVHKVMVRARPEINAMEARLRALGEIGIQLNAKALSPGRIADGYLQVLQELGVPEEARPLLMEMYGDRGVELLIHFYEGINRLLIRLHVLPELKMETGPSMDVSFTLVDDERGSLFEAEFDLLQSKIEKLPYQHWRPGVLLNMNFLPPASVMTSVHEAAIEKVETIFVDLLQDERISQRVRHELSKLVACLLIVSLAEPAQLDADRSPVNLFLKQLSLLGMRDQEAKMQMFLRITAVVNRIVSEHGHNIESFRSGAQVLYTIARSEVQRRLAKRTTQAPAAGYQT